MAVKLIGGLVGLVVVVVLLQSVLFGGDDSGPAGQPRGGAVPTATLPAQLPEPVMLGESAGQPGGPGDAGGGANSYVVQSGDTLGAIAAKLGVSPDEQAAWTAQVLQINAIPDARTIQVGQTLQLPAGSATAKSTPTRSPSATASATTRAGATATPSPRATPTPRATSGGGSGSTYTVVSGDTPLSIAAKFCVEDALPWANELLTLNGAEAGSLNIGDVLELPAGTPGC